MKIVEDSEEIVKEQLGIVLQCQKKANLAEEEVKTAYAKNQITYEKSQEVYQQIQVIVAKAFEVSKLVDESQVRLKECYDDFIVEKEKREQQSSEESLSSNIEYLNTVYECHQVAEEFNRRLDEYERLQAEYKRLSDEYYQLKEKTLQEHLIVKKLSKSTEQLLREVKEQIVKLCELSGADVEKFGLK